MRRTHATMQIVAALLDDPLAKHWGYELGKGAGVRSGVLYPILRRMLDEGWLADGWEDPDDAGGKRPPRRYYTLTAEGVTTLRAVMDDARADARFAALLGGLS